MSDKLRPVDEDILVDRPLAVPDIDPVPVAPVPDIDFSYEPPTWSEMQLGRIMMLLSAFSLFGITLVVSFAVAIWGGNDAWERVSDLLKSIIPVETLIIGAAVSYYFKTGKD